MKLVVIVERRTTHRYVYIPALDTGTALADRDEPGACARVLVTAALGAPAADLQMTLHHARLGETVVSTPTVDVEVLHDDGVWRTAQHTGWLRHWHGSWGPLVTYMVDGISWTRAVHIPRMRSPLAQFPVAPQRGERRVSGPQPVS
jgi:hypothetical protein